MLRRISVLGCALVPLLVACSPESDPQASQPVPTATQTIVTRVPITAKPSAQQLKERCLWASLVVYPTWPKGNGPVVDNIVECKSLSVETRTQIRKLVTAFVLAGNARLEENR